MSGQRLDSMRKRGAVILQAVHRTQRSPTVPAPLPGGKDGHQGRRQVAKADSLYAALCLAGHDGRGHGHSLQADTRRHADAKRLTRIVGMVLHLGIVVRHACHAGGLSGDLRKPHSRHRKQQSRHRPGGPFRR